MGGDDRLDRNYIFYKFEIKEKMINKIFHIKPSLFLIAFFVIQILAFLISAGLISILDTSSISLTILVFFTFNISPILLWYLYTGNALFLKDKKGNRKKEFIKFRLSVLTIFFSVLISSIIGINKSSINTAITISISLCLGILGFISTIFILSYWVKGFVWNYDKRTETKSDYLNYIYLLCIPPIGIYVIQKLINTTNSSSKELNLELLTGKKKR